MPSAREELRIALIGAGKMGQAMLAGWLDASSGAAKELTADNFVVVNPGADKRQLLAQRFGVSCIEDVSSLDPAALVVLAVKPQVLPRVLEQLAVTNWVADALVVSIAAGVTTSSIAENLPAGTHVVRVMPNTALSVGEGVSVVCAGPVASKEDAQLVLDLFSCIGLALEVDESQMDIATAISGSGPAYVAALVEALTQAAEEAGMDARVAQRLAASMVLGAGKIMTSGQSAQQTRIDVSSPGGTTLAALSAMEDAGYSESIKRGVAAAIARAKELGA